MSKGKVGGIVTGVILLIIIIMLLICGEFVPTGYKAVIYSMNGGANGETLGQGFHIISPMKKTKLFTVGNEQLLLTKDNREGSKDDDSFKVSTADDASIAISFQMSYRFIEENLVDTYKKFKAMSGEEIVNNRVKTVLKSKISEVTTSHTMMDIYSGNRAAINDKLTEYLNESFKESYGIEVLDASIVDVHPDEKLKEAIDNRVTALQQKQQAEAEQEKVKVDVATTLIKAENDAKIKVTEAKAEAEANKIKSQSITENLIKMTEAEARLEHGWITVNGANTVVTDDK